MPTNITDVSTFTDPCTRPSGSDVRNSASVQAPFQALANRTRYLADLLGGATGIGEWLYPATKARKRALDLSMFQFPTQNDGTARWKILNSGGDTYARPLVEASVAQCVIDAPAGAVLTSVEAWIKASSSRAGANRWALAVYKATLGASSVGSATLLGSAADDGGATGNMKLTVSGLTEDIFNETGLYRVVVIGPTGTLTDDDLLFAARVNFTALGPRGD